MMEPPSPSAIRLADQDAEPERSLRVDGVDLVVEILADRGAGRRTPATCPRCSRARHTGRTRDRRRRRGGRSPPIGRHGRRRARPPAGGRGDLAGRSLAVLQLAAGDRRRRRLRRPGPRQWPGRSPGCRPSRRRPCRSGRKSSSGVCIASGVSESSLRWRLEPVQLDRVLVHDLALLSGPQCGDLLDELEGGSGGGTSGVENRSRT